MFSSSNSSSNREIFQQADCAACQQIVLHTSRLCCLPADCAAYQQIVLLTSNGDLFLLE